MANKILFVFGFLLLASGLVKSIAGDDGNADSARAIVLWDGKDTFGWSLPALKSGNNSGQTLFGRGGVWEHGTKFGPGKIRVFFEEGEKATLHFYRSSDDGKVKSDAICEGAGGSQWSNVWEGEGVFRLGFESAGAKVKRVEYHPSQMKPLFNGKDLSGWKVFPGKKSDYKWQSEGWLSVKNGPGDIHSEQTFDNFLAQVEVRTNGKHLNSGIFFRGIPGQYWMGYEAQVRNQFNDKPDQKYSIEIYDPKSNKLESKKDVFANAVDYGTGAIYRRVPARIQASKDNEWFTMTISAQNRQISTWVNGIQVTDWTDNRPANDNPRQGFRSAPGVFSIQGHDPTTDIDFRNFRVQSNGK
jgi:hypothetical protein